MSSRPIVVISEMDMCVLKSNKNGQYAFRDFSVRRICVVAKGRKSATDPSLSLAKMDIYRDHEVEHGQQAC